MTIKEIADQLEELNHEINGLHRKIAVGQNKGDEPHDSIEEAYKGGIGTI